MHIKYLPAGVHQPWGTYFRKDEYGCRHQFIFIAVFQVAGMGNCLLNACIGADKLYTY